MPPHPDLLQRVASGSAMAPYYLQHHDELVARGINAPHQIPNMRDLMGRHTLDTPFNALVVLVDFSDRASLTPAVSFSTLMFGTQSGSLNHFIQQITYSNLSLVTANLPGDVGWTRLPHPYSYYVNGQNGMGTYPRNSQGMVEDAVNLLNPSVDFSIYDNDGDGYVDALFVVHAGPGAELTGNSNDIWSHAWGVPSPISVDGVSVSSYSTEPEYWQVSGDMTCGVYAHEMGHAAFGLPDLYDYGYDSEGVGRWSLMAGGSWNGTLGSSPAHPDAWCKIQMGVVTPTTLTNNQNGVSFPAVETSPTVYRLGDPGTQYFLVENRQQTGYDTGLPGNGLLIWHIDEAVYGNNNQWYPGHTTSGHYMVALEQADGLWQMEHDLNRGNSGDPYPGSTNNLHFTDTSTPNSKNYASAATGVSVRNISPSRATMTADLTVPGARNLFMSEPNGGEMWYSGDIDTILWSSANITGTIKIEYNLSYPSIVWTTVTTSAPNTGLYRWRVPLGISSNVRVRISSVTYPSLMDTSDANLSIDRRTVWVSSPQLSQTWLIGDVDTIKWTSQNLPENVKIEINRSYPSTTWSVIAASVPNTGAYAWTVSRAASTHPRIRVTGVTHTAIGDTCDAFAIAARTILVTSPNSALTWVLGDSAGVRWSSTNLSGEPVKIELNRNYPSTTWEILTASTPNTGSFNLVATGPLTTRARVRVRGTIHSGICDSSNVNFSIGQRSVTVTFPNTATTCLVGGPDTIRWTSTCMTGEAVDIQIDRNYPSGSWESIAAGTTNTGWYRWVVNGPVSAAARVRIINVGHPLVGDTSNVNFAVAIPQLTVTTPDGGEIWYAGDADTIRWATQNLTENVKIELNRNWPTGTYTVLASSAPNTGWFRWVVTNGTTVNTRIRISPVSHSFARDSSNASFTISARTITLTYPTAAGITCLAGDTATISWTMLNVPDDSVKIEINRSYSTGTWSVIAARAINSGSYRWRVSGANTTTARIRVTGLRHPAATGLSANNFTIGNRRITVTAPNSAVTWNSGTTYPITWTTSYMGPESVRVELNRNYPSSAWEVLQNATPNNGVWRWVASGAAATRARIRVIGTIHNGVADTSNVNFSIRAAGVPALAGDVEPGTTTPTEFHLAQNYPNPFNPTTRIAFDVPQASLVRLEVFNMLGARVGILVDGQMPAGSHQVSFNASALPSGLYIYRLTAGKYSGMQRMILLK
jgi:M6 family metalloprotease-like protein